MFYKIYRCFAAVVSALIVMIMSAVFIFEKTLPDNFYAKSRYISLPGIYGDLLSLGYGSPESEPAISMKKSVHSATLKLMGTIPVKEVSITVSDEKIVTVCGSPFGVKMFTDGVLVVGFSNIESQNGSCCPAAESGLEKGDIIKSVCGNSVYTNEDVAEYIENCKGSPIEMEVLRGKDYLTVSIKPEILSDKSGYKAGFWVRDSSAGIGTMTFYDPETMVFAGLGHAVCDIDTGSPIPFLSGEIVPASITKINKGYTGSPGELGGAFTGGDIGKVMINSETGLYGTLDYEIEGFSAPIAHKQDVYEGAAVIYSTLDGCEVVEYDIEIEQINFSDDSMTKNMIIRVTDEDLIALSGGIVQGMSGSPIVQDGKLVGAVTHVFVNDPTKGFGIFAENMLEISGGCG